MSAAHLRGHRLNVVEAPRQPTRLPDRWEYRRLSMLPLADLDLASLNAAGAEGWEVIHTAELYRAYLLKRRVT
jgi:hypothetical protein